MTTGYLGIDIGLSGARATVISETGRLLARSKIDKSTAELTPRQLGLLMDKVVKLALRGATRLRIAAMAVCAFGPAPIFLDSRRDVLAMLPLFGNQPRSKKPVAPDQFPDDLEGRVDHLRRDRPEVFKQARYLCDVTGYLVYRLTNNLVMDSVTADDYRRISLPRRIALPTQLNVLDRAGQLTKAASGRLGLPIGVPVAAGSYDSIADLAAAGFPKQAKAAIILGSTLVIGIQTQAPVKDRSLRSMRHPGAGWFSGGWTNCAGSAIALGERILAKPSQQRSCTLPLMLPYFSGERAPVWSQDASGLITGIRLDTTSADLSDAFRQAVTLSAADIAMRLEREFGVVKRWRVVGGGTRDPELMQDLADSLGASLDVPSGADAHLGPALLAAQHCGKDVRLPVARTRRADPARHRLHREKLHLYRRIFDAMQPLMSDIARLTRRETQAR